MTYIKAELDSISPAAIMMRSFGFSLEEVANVGALLLFLHGNILHRTVSDYRITACETFARVETLGECAGIWEGPSILEALQAAVVGITERMAFPSG